MHRDGEFGGQRVCGLQADAVHADRELEGLAVASLVLRTGVGHARREFELVDIDQLSFDVGVRDGRRTERDAAAVVANHQGVRFGYKADPEIRRVTVRVFVSGVADDYAEQKRAK